MNICHVGKNYQMRAAKVAESCAGVTNFYIGDGPPMFVQSSQFDLFNLTVLKKDKLQRAVRALEPIVDIFHVHTRPDNILPWVKQATKKPVVWDVHDLFSLYDDSFKWEEIECRHHCDAIVSVNPELTKLAADRSGPEVPSTYYRTMVPKGWYPPVEKGEENHMVIATGLSVEPGHFRYWIDVFKKIHELGINLHVYSSQYKPVQEYVDTGVDVHGATPLSFLLGIMSRAEACLCGFPCENDLTKIAAPNKYYEALACGVPIIWYGGGIMADEVKEKGLGVVVQSAEEIPEALKKIRKDNIRDHIRKVRFSYCMETQIERLMKLYYQVVNP